VKAPVSVLIGSSVGSIGHLQGGQNSLPGGMGSMMKLLTVPVISRSTALWLGSRLAILTAVTSIRLSPAWSVPSGMAS
jgi:hypothetical protein